MEAFFPEYEQVEPLLRIRVVLSMVRELCEAGELTSFRTRGELYLQVHEHLTTRAARRLGLAPDGVALTPVPEEELVAVGLLSEEVAKRQRPEQRNFVRCPPAELDIDNQPFWMATSEKAKAKVKFYGTTYDAFSDSERPPAASRGCFACLGASDARHPSPVPVVRRSSRA